MQMSTSQAQVWEPRRSEARRSGRAQGNSGRKTPRSANGRHPKTTSNARSAKQKHLAAHSKCRRLEATTCGTRRTSGRKQPRTLTSTAEGEYETITFPIPTARDNQKRDRDHATR